MPLNCNFGVTKNRMTDNIQKTNELEKRELSSNGNQTETNPIEKGDSEGDYLSATSPSIIDVVNLIKEVAESEKITEKEVVKNIIFSHFNNEINFNLENNNIAIDNSNNVVETQNTLFEELPLYVRIGIIILPILAFIFIVLLLWSGIEVNL